MIIRAAKADDQHYVAATWTRSLARAGRRFDEANELVDRLLDDALTRVIVAERNRVIVGWAAALSDRALHYVYVRRRDRGEGIAKLLVRAAVGDRPLVYTMRGPDAAALLAKRRAEEYPVAEYLEGT